MKNCTEINELLSAYSDNELTEADKQSVEEHLAACENCSALLEIYREISISAEESNVPVPDALRIGVMNRIRSELVTTETVKETKKKKWWQHQVILTRLAPIAACLTVVLLVWQFGGNMFVRTDMAAPFAPPMPESLQATADYPMAPAAAPAAENYAWDSGDRIGKEFDSLFPEAAGGIDNYSPFADTSLGPNRRTGDSMFEGESLDDAEVIELQSRISTFFSQAYAEITITGELPAMLHNYDPLPLENWEGWDLVFEIPSTEVSTLLIELLNRPGVSLVRAPHNQNSTFAIVFYSRGG